jgi:glycosyltransferase involved in cell wall biosynthesis
MKKTTLLIPTLNSEKYLNQALISLESEKKKIRKILVIDGGSVDNTLKIIENYPRKIKLLKKKGNIAKCLNIGFKYSDTSYVSRLDSDDCNINSRLEKQIKFLEKNKDYALVGSNFNIIDSNNIKYNNIRYRSLQLTYENIILKFISDGEIDIAHPAVTIKKKFAKKVNYYSDLDFSEDYNLWIKILFKKFKIANLKEKGINLRKHDGQTSIINQIKSIQSVKMSYLNFINKYLNQNINIGYINLLMIRYINKNNLNQKLIKKYYTKKIIVTKQLIKFFDIKINFNKIQEFELKNLNYNSNAKFFFKYLFYKIYYLKNVQKEFKIDLNKIIYYKIKFYFFCLFSILKYYCKKIFN